MGTEENFDEAPKCDTTKEICCLQSNLTISAPDQEVARFLHQSKLHLAKLQKAFEDLATVKVLMSIKDVENEFEETMRFLFCPLQKALDLISSDLCSITLFEFLKDYEACELAFVPKELLHFLAQPIRTKSNIPLKYSTCNFHTSDNEEIMLLWTQDFDTIKLAGPKAAIRAKSQDLRNRGLDCVLNESLPSEEFKTKVETSNQVSTQSLQIQEDEEQQNTPELPNHIDQHEKSGSSEKGSEHVTETSSFDEDKDQSYCIDNKDDGDWNKEQTKSFICSESEKKFILKYLFPALLEVTETPTSFSVNKPRVDIEIFENVINEISWLKKDQMEYISRGLKDHFASEEWKDMIDSLQRELSFIVDTKVTAISDSYGSKVNSMVIRNKKVAVYGDVSVSVEIGNVANSKSEGIINLVMDDNFNLFHGGLTSAEILRLAGSSIQDECNEAFEPQRPLIRVTSGHRLHQRLVVHANISETSTAMSPDTVKIALRIANEKQASSVTLPIDGPESPQLGNKKTFRSSKSLPSLSTRVGVIVIHGIDDLDAAIAISQAIEMFIESTEEHKLILKDIKVIVRDEKMLDVFCALIVPGKDKQTLGKIMFDSEQNELSSPSVNEKVLVTICSNNSTTAEKVKRRIEKQLEETTVTIKNQQSILACLEDYDLLDIYRMARAESVSASVNCKDLQITLNGRCGNVKRVETNIQELLNKINEARMSKKGVYWMWCGIVTTEFTLLPVRICAEVERIYKNNKNDIHSFSFLGNTLEVDFSKMTCCFKSILRGRLQREDVGDVPEEWSRMVGVKKTWIKHKLDSSSSEYLKVWKSFRASKPKHNPIESIERIQNLALYKRYVEEKSNVEKKTSMKHSVEKELFLSVSEKDVCRIFEKGFDRYSGVQNGANFGKGCHFAKNSSYYMNKTTTNKNTCIVVARVVTGEFCAGKPTMMEAPEKRNGESSALKQEFYDSVVDDVADPQLYVLFGNPVRAYPSYQITFAK